MRWLVLGLVCSCVHKDELVSTPSSDTSGSDDTASEEGDDTAAMTECDALGFGLSQELTSTELHPAPLGEPGAILGSCGWGLAVADLDDDGALDVLLAGAWADTWPLKNQDGVLVPSDSIVFDGGLLPPGNGLAVGDVNGDGQIDVVLTRSRGLSDVVYINTGDGRFEGTALTEAVEESQTPTLFDADQDGDLDLFIARHIDLRDMDLSGLDTRTLRGSVNGFYLNDGTGVFVPVDAPGTVDAASFQAAPLDVDNDGDLDLYIANDFGPWIAPNELLINDGTGGFTVDSECGCDISMFAMGVSVSDANDDGAPDMYVTDMGTPNLLLNDGTGGFYDATIAMDAAVPSDEVHEGSWGTSFVDLDQDGFEDLATVYGPVQAGLDIDWTDLVSDEAAADLSDPSGQHDVLLLRDGTGFEDVSETFDFQHDALGRAVVVADLNQDGMPDIVTAGITDERHQYLRVHFSEGGCGPGVKISAPTLPATALGARVDVAVSGRELTRWLLPSTTFSSSAPELYVGFNGHEQADWVRIRTMDGTVWYQENVPAGSTILLSATGVALSD
ncbi:MAG: CRTAC1 family protein [Myxococcota bacterium]